MEKEKPISKEDYRKSQEKYLSNLETFAYGGVAGKALIEKDLNSAHISLEKLATDMGLDDDRLEGFVKGTFSSDKGIETAAAIYANTYEIAREKLTISNLWKHYDEYATKYLGDLKAKADEEIDKFGNNEFGEIKGKYLAAKEIVKSRTSNFTEEQKEKAEKEVEEYEKVVITLEKLDKAYLRKYTNSVDEEADMKDLREMYSEKKQQWKSRNGRR